MSPKATAFVSTRADSSFPRSLQVVRRIALRFVAILAVTAATATHGGAFDKFVDITYRPCLAAVAGHGERFAG